LGKCLGRGLAEERKGSRGVLGWRVGGGKDVDLCSLGTGRSVGSHEMLYYVLNNIGYEKVIANEVVDGRVN
jgi:hypothetical protein